MRSRMGSDEERVVLEHAGTSTREHTELDGQKLLGASETNCASKD